jgi:predicted O-methyltransferase YrrM
MSSQPAHLLRSYFRYIFTAKSKFGVHSPFTYDLITTVFEKKDQPEAFDQIHRLYKELCRSSRVLETTDFGVLSSRKAYETRFLKVSEIASGSSICEKTGHLLFRLVQKIKPQNILELGTSLGISTLYIAKAAPEARVTTMEGCAAKVEVAKSNFAKLNARNIEIKTGRFDTQLPALLEQVPSLDFVFMDGHHQYKATMSYFSQILKHSNEGTVIVLDDIHWSRGMEKAWKEIQGIPEVIVTVDLFRTGLIFLRKSLSKQHFVIRY